MINSIEKFFLKKKFSIKRDFNSSFELTCILLFVVFYSYNKNSRDSVVNQHLMNLYILDLDESFRKLGIGDMKIGKYVKSYVKKIYYRFYKLEFIIKNNNFDEFNKYIIKRNIQNNVNVSLSTFLFNFISYSIKKAKTKDLADFRFEFYLNKTCNK